ncbi:hypothetical protein ACFOMD_14390 [Sphingoaurantiacus capsulatus]|uniref:Uncharacterized protein n=1 Tax=Sphingoaurantiacus capsulatus TaxID=1771310 RepID=A0ABV7XEP6_9SPHN
MRSAAPLAALLGAALPFATADAMPLRHAGALAVSCPIAGLPAAAAPKLCAQVAEAARRGAPFPVALAARSDAALSLVVGGSMRDGKLTLAAQLLRPGQPQAAALTAPATRAVPIKDEAAVRAAIEAALAAVLPWQRTARSQPPRAPRAE